MDRPKDKEAYCDSLAAHILGMEEPSTNQTILKVWRKILSFMEFCCPFSMLTIWKFWSCQSSWIELNHCISILWFAPDLYAKYAYFSVCFFPRFQLSDPECGETPWEVQLRAMFLPDIHQIILAMQLVPYNTSTVTAATTTTTATTSTDANAASPPPPPSSPDMDGCIRGGTVLKRAIFWAENGGAGEEEEMMDAMLRWNPLGEERESFFQDQMLEISEGVELINANTQP